MAVWAADETSPAKRACDLHREVTGRSPSRCASAPGTWVLIGENVDHFGGVTLLGLTSLRAAAAVSPRTDETIRIELRGPDGYSISSTGSLDALQEEGSLDRLTRRVIGLVSLLISRQVISRDTRGLDISLVTDILPGAGLGSLYAGDAALALALAGDDPEIDEAPLRARLAEICSHNVTLNSPLAVLRARHTAALRGKSGTISVVDYADGSVTQAPHPARLGVRIFAVTESWGEPYDRQTQRIAERRAFIDAACANFGVDSLRQLPNAAERVVEWVEARRQVTGPDSAPAPEVARSWVRFCETETLRSLATAKALRSRRDNELFTLLNSASEQHDLDTPDALVSDLLSRGARSARPAAAGNSPAALAFVPLRAAEAFLASTARDYEVVEVLPGEVARVEDISS
ncbi:galactokinase family protein [Corynebacterium auris]|uniref:galactokinase family protein n=1 Tax=Corynebacterium auris TaxID=44750 RepID=UPI0025B5456B|nr:galactokinase family protein [Corynebacterium auris]WJY68478.1 galactokinase [Corynebacterium auris]